MTLSAPLGESGQRRLVAKYDLIVLTPEGRAVIFDWKTSHHLQLAAALAGRTAANVVYPYLLVQAGIDLNAGRPLAADRIEMVLLVCRRLPDQPERFVYSPAQGSEDEGYLHALVERIVLLAGGEGKVAIDARRNTMPLLRLQVVV